MEFGLPKESFTAEGHLTGASVPIRLPASLFRDREFVVDCKPDAVGDRAVQFQVNGKSAVVAAANGASYKKLLAGHAAFRQVFPLFLCFPAVVPVDEVVSLKMFHREDEPLERLFLDAEQKARLDKLWWIQWPDLKEAHAFEGNLSLGDDVHNRGLDFFGDALERAGKATRKL